jgi:hypothetical protein
MLPDPTAICPACSAKEDSEITPAVAEKKPSPTWLNVAILFFPIWGIALFAWLSNVAGSPGIATIGIGLALFSSLPIILSDSLTVLAKVFLTVGYYWLAVPASVVTILAIVGRA